jgi:uncharacterized protein involved in tolerance to divalent cations
MALKTCANPAERRGTTLARPCRTTLAACCSRIPSVTSTKRTSCFVEADAKPPMISKVSSRTVSTIICTTSASYRWAVSTTVTSLRVLRKAVAPWLLIGSPATTATWIGAVSGASPLVNRASGTALEPGLPGSGPTRPPRRPAEDCALRLRPCEAA